MDGTPCTADSFDKCVAGTCVAAGCDHQLDSTVKLGKQYKKIPNLSWNVSPFYGFKNYMRAKTLVLKEKHIISGLILLIYINFFL